MQPAFKDDWATVYSVDALTGLQEMPEKSVHTAITSPPYWGLRSYLPAGHPDKAMELGAEKAPELYVERLVEVFRALRRVLRDDGTLWLNLGDAYAGSWGNQGRKEDRGTQRPINGPMMQNLKSYPETTSKTGSWVNERSDMKPKDLIGLPWMAAFALRSDGWYLRSEITWCKKAPMPESVTDRPTSATEKLFLLTKKPRYFYDSEAVKEKSVKGAAGSTFTEGKTGVNGNGRVSGKPREESGSRNLRNYWILGPAPYKGAHYATFPLDLIYPCIKAGTSERGVCEACGAPWERVVERQGSYQERKANGGGRAGNVGVSDSYQNAVHAPGLKHDLDAETRTVGWQSTCSCGTDTVPATVLDPFMGSGTTALAARKLGRRSIGLDLDERNVKQIEERLGWQGVMF